METSTLPSEIGAFRAHLSERLRTPLNAVIGFAELLALQPSGLYRADDVQQILSAARELLAVVERELNAPPQHSAERPPAPPAVCDVLYIEDDEVNFMLVERILEYRPKVKLKQAATGQAGIEAARTDHPKLILLDLNLPDIHGADVLHLLQSSAVTAQIPVVVLSANATPSYIERLLTAGARNYLTKPFDIDPFLAVIDEFTAEEAR